MNIKVSIVIVNWNTNSILEACLNSIYKETSSNLIEVIVIDNNSSDGSCEMVKQKYPDVILLENQDNLGFTQANNQGFAVARGEYVLMLNSDTVILDRAIEKVLSYADLNPSVGVIGCKLRYPDMRFQNSCFRYPSIVSVVLSATYLSQIFKNSMLFNMDRYGNCEWDSERDVDCVMGSFLFVKKNILEKVGFLDTEYFMYGEETDLCFRIKRAGWKIRYYPDTEIIHIYGGSQKGPESIAWSYMANTYGILRFIAKNRSVSQAYVSNLIMLICIVPRLIAWCLYDCVNTIRTGEFRQRQLLKAGIIRYHLKVFIKPSALFGKWKGRQ